MLRTVYYSGMKTLFLTPQEQAVFDALSDDLKEGWETEGETLTYDDTPQKRMIRLSLLRLHDPVLLELRDRAEKAQSPEELANLLHDLDLKDIDDGDLASLFFALGPVVLSQLISHLLGAVTNDKDIEGVTALTVIRHSILSSFRSVSR
jgi:hypothetical protein